MMEENKTKGFMQKPVVQFFVAVLVGLVVPLIFAAIFYKSFYHGDDRLGDVLEFSCLICSINGTICVEYSFP